MTDFRDRHDAEVLAEIDALFDAANAEFPMANWWSGTPLKVSENVAAILKLPKPQQCLAAVIAHERYAAAEPPEFMGGAHFAGSWYYAAHQNMPVDALCIAQKLLARTLPWEGADLQALLELLLSCRGPFSLEAYPPGTGLCKTLVKHAAGSGELKSRSVQELVDRWKIRDGARDRKCVANLRAALAALPEPADTRNDEEADIDPGSELYLLLEEVAGDLARRTDPARDLGRCKAFTRASELPMDRQAALTVVALERYAAGDGPTFDGLFHDERDLGHVEAWVALAGRLLQRKLPWTDGLLTRLVRAAAAVPRSLYLWDTPAASGIVKLLEDRADPKLTGELGKAVATLIGKWPSGAKAKRLHAITGTRAKCFLPAADVWCQAAQPVVDADDAWAELMNHAMLAEGGKPTKTWAAKAQELRAVVGSFVDRVAEWFPLADVPRNADEQDQDRSERGYTAHPNLLSDTSEVALKGLCWLTADLDSTEAARAVGSLAVSAYKKLPGIGPRAVKVGNAAVWAVGQMPSEAALAQLAYLKAKVKFGTAQRLIGKAFEAKAAAMGVSPEDVEEMGVPALGLTGVGERVEAFGDFTAETSVDTSGKATTAWRKPDGKTQKSVPAAVKSDHADRLKEMKSQLKDLSKMLPAQKERLDRLFLRTRPWSAEAWRERYFDHPVVGVLARRLIWTVKTGDLVVQASSLPEAAGDAGASRKLAPQLADLKGRPVDVPDDAEITLWHPLDSPAGDVLAWRERLAELQITQPFKQAHREVYVLTDAERNTGTYSNRFAAHVLKQHQFNALAKSRGWKAVTRMMVDDEYPPVLKELPDHGLRAEYWVEGIGDDFTAEYVLDSGSFRYVATDQVRFYGADAAANSAHASGGGYGSHGRDVRANLALPLTDVPAKVFSEVMRDVDLFVGVASVGNDPNWQDGGPEGRFRDYWQDYSFGDLSTTAKTRKAVLGRLVPRLKIADRCSFADRFLVVRGDVRTYKIHLGSGNILIDPGDRYLCIVPNASQAKADTPMLPFEGDRTLSVILSKAFLLAADDKITDRTILSQL